MNKRNEMFESLNLINEEPGGFYFWELINRSNILIVSLKRFGLQDEILKIEFSGILSYRYSIEAARMKTINENQFAGVINSTISSDYLSWFIEESGDIFNTNKLAHILICSSDCIIETITDEVPNVSWLKF